MGAAVSSAFVCEICCLTPLCSNLLFTLLKPPWLMLHISQEESVPVSLFSFLRMGWVLLTVGLPDGPLSPGMLSDDREQKKTSF